MRRSGDQPERASERKKVTRSPETAERHSAEMGNYVRMFTRIQLNRGALSPLIGLHEEGEDDDVVVDDDGTAHTFNHKCFWVFPLLTKVFGVLKRVEACSGFLDSCLRLGFICCACVLCRVLEKFEGGSLFLRIMFLLHFENCLSIFFYMMNQIHVQLNIH